MLVLGLESTCDETGCSVVENGKRILSNSIASQADLHAIYGGVFPEMACRRHLEVMVPIMQEALECASVSKQEIDLIAVAKGPGLIGPLLMGMHAAKTLAVAWNKPLIGVDHVEAHIYSAMMGCFDLEFPALGIVISGGHTFLVHILDFGVYKIIGKTVDDAIGEAFDKVAVMLGLRYPGGPEIERLAQSGNPHKYPFKPGVVKSSPWDFSFSGLKTNVLYTVKGQNQDKDGPSILPDSERAHIAASFQEAALKDIVDKTIKASEVFPCKAIFFGGGVTNNNKLRDLVYQKITKIPVHWPPHTLSLDNAAMIAGLGYHIFLKQGYSDPLDMEPTLTTSFKNR